MTREKFSRNQILSSYNFSFPNGPCRSDGYYHLHLHDIDGKCIARSVKAKSIDELKDKVYLYHKDMLHSAASFADMFRLAQADVFRYVKPDSDAYHSRMNSNARRQQHFMLSDAMQLPTRW